MKISLRQATKQDLPEVLSMIKELALYEKAPQEVTVTLEELERDGFSERPLFEVILACHENQILGMAFYFFSYSTWKGRCIYLEDIIVKEQFRGQKIGLKLFEAVIKKSKSYSARRMQWQVLNWNEPAINFYKKLNAQFDPSWINCKLTYEQIQSY